MLVRMRFIGLTTTEMDFLYVMARGIGLMGADGVSKTFMTAALYCPARVIDPILDRYQEGPKNLHATHALSRALSIRTTFFITKSYLIKKRKIETAKEPSFVETILERVSHILGQDFRGDYASCACDDGGICLTWDEGPFGSLRRFKITPDGRVLFTLFPNRYSVDVIRLQDAPQDRIDPSRVAEANKFLTARNLTEKVRNQIQALRIKFSS